MPGNEPNMFLRPLIAHQTFSRALGRGLHAPRLPCQLCPGAFCFCEPISGALGAVWRCWWDDARRCVNACKLVSVVPGRRARPWVGPRLRYGLSACWRCGEGSQLTRRRSVRRTRGDGKFTITPYFGPCARMTLWRESPLARRLLCSLSSRSRSVKFTFNEFGIPSAASSGHYAITAGPDGNLWFVEHTGNMIGRITTAGVITQFAIPTANSAPYGITLGPDGNLWFTESVGKIGRITTAGTITEFTIPANY